MTVRAEEATEPVSTETPAPFHRALLKLSGEALLGGREYGIDPQTVEAERSIFTNSDEVQSKPEAAREKIVDGMLAKRFYAATPGGVLADQAWIHDASKTVAQALDEAGASVARFARISVAGS